MTHERDKRRDDTVEYSCVQDRGERESRRAVHRSETGRRCRMGRRVGLVPAVQLLRREDNYTVSIGLHRIREFY